jgi:hypothetical protein
MSRSSKFSRRQFLSTAAGSTAASLLARPALASIPSKAFGSLDWFDLGISGDLLPWRDQGLINTSKSPYARLHSVPVGELMLWEPLLGDTQAFIIGGDHVQSRWGTKP